MPAWVGLGALGEAGAGFLEGRNAAEMEAYKRKLDREGIAEKQEELGISKGYLENARKRDAIEAAREKRLQAAGMLPQEIPPRPGWPTMTADGKPIAWFAAPDGRVFSRIADVPAGTKFAPSAAPLKGKWAEDIAEFEAVMGRKPTPAEAMRLKEGRPKAGGEAKPDAFQKRVADYRRAFGKEPSEAIKQGWLGVKAPKQEQLTPRVVKDRLVNLSSAEKNLDAVEDSIKKYAKYFGPFAGRTYGYMARRLWNKEVSKAATEIQLQVANAIQATGAGARGFGPQERGFFHQLAEAPTKTTNENLGIIEAWRNYLRNKRSAELEGYPSFNDPSFKKLFGKDADLMDVGAISTDAASPIPPEPEPQGFPEPPEPE